MRRLRSLDEYGDLARRREAADDQRQAVDDTQRVVEKAARGTLQRVPATGVPIIALFAQATGMTVDDVAALAVSKLFFLASGSNTDEAREILEELLRIEQHMYIVYEPQVRATLDAAFRGEHGVKREPPWWLTMLALCDRMNVQLDLSFVHVPADLAHVADALAAPSAVGAQADTRYHVVCYVNDSDVGHVDYVETVSTSTDADMRNMPRTFKDALLRAQSLIAAAAPVYYGATSEMSNPQRSATSGRRPRPGPTASPVVLADDASARRRDEVLDGDDDDIESLNDGIPFSARVIQEGARLITRLAESMASVHFFDADMSNEVAQKGLGPRVPHDSRPSLLVFILSTPDTAPGMGVAVVYRACRSRTRGHVQCAAHYAIADYAASANAPARKASRLHRLYTEILNRLRADQFYTGNNGYYLHGASTPPEHSDNLADAGPCTLVNLAKIVEKLSLPVPTALSVSDAQAMRNTLKRPRERLATMKLKLTRSWGANYRSTLPNNKNLAAITYIM